MLTAKQGIRQNGWEWQNRATELKGQILQLATEQAKPLRARGPGLTGIFRLKTEKSIDEKNASLQSVIDSIDAKLEALEAKYLA